MEKNSQKIVHIFTTPRQNSFTDPYRESQGLDKLIILPKLRGKTKKPISKFITLSQVF